MSVADLLSLRSDIDKTLQTRRSDLEDQLRQIGGGSSGDRPRRGRPPSTQRRTKAPIKYRHPSSGETWSGRGAVARWLAAEIKAGKKKEDFLVDGGKPGRKARKKKASS